MLSRNRFCLLDGKIPHKSPDHLFYLNFFDSMLYIISFLASVLSFFIWIAEIFPKNSLLSAGMFFIDSALFYRFSVLRILSLIFICKNFLAIKNNSSPSWQPLFPVEVNYFNRTLISLIILWGVMYESSFQVCEGRWWKKILEGKTLKLGDAHVHPQ